MKFAHTEENLPAIEFSSTELLDATTVTEAFRLIGCTKQAAKERCRHFFFAMETLLEERSNNLSIKKKAGLYERELQRQEREHANALRGISRMLD